MASAPINMIDAAGENTIVDSSVEIIKENSQNDGRGFFIGSECVIYPHNRFVLGDLGGNPDAHVSIGSHVLINVGGYISGEGGLYIEDYALIGPHVCILSAGHQYDDPQTPIRNQALTYGKIVIERDAWIGASSVVLQGVTVGRGAVVGAGSVINKDIPAFAVAVGNPARVIKYRDPAKMRVKTTWKQRLSQWLSGNN